MTGRAAILDRIRTSLNVDPATDDARRRAVADRLAGHPRHLVPARGQLPRAERIDLFCRMAEAVSATVARLSDPADVPEEVAACIRRRNLPQAVRRGADPRLASLPWDRVPTLDVAVGTTDGSDLSGVSHAFAAIAETGTLALTSGPDNPTALNFLPDNHIVVLDADDIAGDLETAFDRVRQADMPRTLNLITGPSRSADIEQTLLLGAHGPRTLHIIVVDGAAEV